MKPSFSPARDHAVTWALPGCDLGTGAAGEPRHSALMELNPPGQYADSRNLHARQRLWQGQIPSFDIAAWVLDLAGLRPGHGSSMPAAVTASTCGRSVSGG